MESEMSYNAKPWWLKAQKFLLIKQDFLALKAAGFELSKLILRF